MVFRLNLIITLIMGLILWTLIVAFAILCIVWLKQMFNRPRLPLPPGPKGLPVIGNLLDLANEKVYVKARDWAREFGDDVISLDVLGNTTIVLNSSEAIADIFVTRGANYSDRPDMPMLIDLMGWDWTFALMRYGNRWKEARRVFHSNFDDMILEHQHIQTNISHELLRNLLRNPSKYLDHLKHYTASIIMKRVYGHDVVDGDDHYVRLNEEASLSTSIAAAPGAFLVDLFPSLKHVPEWFPGAGFKKKAREWRKLSEAMINEPYEMVKEKVNKGNAEPCFVTSGLEEQHNTTSDDALSEELIKITAAVVYAAGQDSNVATLTTFFLAMTLYPEAQRRAQAEIDAVIGSERLPTFVDKDQLPYVHAVIQEVLRWIPVFPLAVPHRATNADQYKGYHIPAGATILGNSWAILHNEEQYPDPEAFKPERYIDHPEVPDPIEIGAFGYGRRSCAGKDMALDTVWIAIASVLSVYDISKAVDDHGNPITPAVELAPGTISHPAPFKCVIKPRSQAALALIQQRYD